MKIKNVNLGEEIYPKEQNRPDIFKESAML